MPTNYLLFCLQAFCLLAFCSHNKLSVADTNKNMNFNQRKVVKKPSLEVKVSFFHYCGRLFFYTVSVITYQSW